MQYIKKTCIEFAKDTASKAPVPGGGSVAALVGSLGAALAHMAGALTVGKKKYQDVEEEIIALMKEGESLQEELLSLVQKDIDGFEPLSKLYSKKAETTEEKIEKKILMQDALEKACEVPLRIMELCARGIEIAEETAVKGSKLVVTDAIAGIVLCKAALQTASFNIYINAKDIEEEERRMAILDKCDGYYEKYSDRADKTVNKIKEELKR